MDDFDVVVVGGGIAGVSVAYELAADRRVCLLEAESALAYHTTGRSAAMFLETYGNAIIRALATASRAFFETPPDTVDAALLSPLAMFYVASQGSGTRVRALYDEVVSVVPDVELFDGEQARTVMPVLRPGWAELAMIEPRAMSIDVAALHQGYVRGLRARYAEVRRNARVVSAARAEHGWQLQMADDGLVRAPVVVNAAGAWADQVGTLFGARSQRLRPLRRTAFMIETTQLPPGTPMLDDIDERFYLKPEAGGALCSPVDETLQEPGDARADEVEIARAIEAINEATTLGIRGIRRSWAGLRTFAPDATPVAGADPDVDGLFWCAGQGGYGIQIAPELARVAAGAVRGEPLPDPALDPARAR